MRILVAILALLIACSPIDTNVPSSLLLPDLSLVDMAGAPPQDLAVVTGPTRIVQRTWTGSDGVVVRMPFDQYDTVEKVSCVPRLATDGVARCLPAVMASYFQDAACSVRIVNVPVGCVPEKYYLGYTVNACGITGAYTGYRTGLKISVTKLYAGGSSCTDVSTLIPAFDFYSLLAVLPPTLAARTPNH